MDAHRHHFLPMSSPQRFEVHFPFDAFRPERTFRLRGAGTLDIERDFVTVRGRRQRPFRRGEDQTHRLRMVDIVNTWTNGELVGFDIRGVDADRTLQFKVASSADAARLLTLLPERKTDEFVTAVADHDTFARQLVMAQASTPVMWALIAANVGIFLLMAMEPLGPTPGAHAAQLVAWGSNASQRTLSGEWWRLATSMFLHGGILHIAFNMFVLLQVGGLVERLFGSARFALLYLMAGVSGSLASVSWAFLQDRVVNSVGASGAIFGVIGALLAFIRQPDSGVPGTIVRDLRGSLSGFLLFNIIAGLIYPYTDNAAHLGGLAGGYVAGWLLARSLPEPGEQR